MQLNIGLNSDSRATQQFVERADRLSRKWAFGRARAQTTGLPR